MIRTRRLSFAARAVLFLFFFNSLLSAQQTNLQFLPINSLSFSTQTIKDISLGYSCAKGPGTLLGGLDIKLTFAKKKGNTQTGGTIGTALMGVVGPGEVTANGFKKNIVGTTFHARAEMHRFISKTFSLGLSFPFSYGSFDIGNTKKQMVSFYNFMGGIQTGMAKRFGEKNIRFNAVSNLGLMGGYREKYEGGVYWENRAAGYINPFLIGDIGLEIMEMKRKIRLTLGHQRYFDSSGNKGLNISFCELSFGFDGAIRKKN